MPKRAPATGAEREIPRGAERKPWGKPRETAHELEDRAARLVSMASVMQAEAMRLYAKAALMREEG